MKDRATPSKRRRDDDDDDDDDRDNDFVTGSVRKSSKRRALDAAFERVEEHEDEDKETEAEVEVNENEDEDEYEFMDTNDNKNMEEEQTNGNAKNDTLKIQNDNIVIPASTVTHTDIDMNDTTTPSTARGMAQSITSPPVTLRLPSQHTPAPKEFRAAYAGNARLKDFVTPAKPSAIEHVNVNGGAETDNDADADVDTDANNSSIGGTDSEIEQMKLKRVAPVQVEEEEEERNEGRKDGLFHYFRSKYLDHPSDGGSTSGIGGTLGLVCIVVVLHMVLMLIGAGAGAGAGILDPVFVWKDMSGVANRTLGTYRRVGILSEPPLPSKLEPMVVEKIVENVILVDNAELAEKERALLRKRKKIAWWKVQKDTAAAEILEYEQLVEDEVGAAELILSDLGDETRGTMERLDKLAQWERSLMKSHIVAENEDDDVDEIIQEILEVSEMPIPKESATLISFENVFLPGEECEGGFILESGGTEEVYVTEDAVIEAKNDMNSLIIGTYNSDIIHEEESFKPIEDWMQVEIEKLTEEHSFNADLTLNDFVLPSSAKRDRTSVGSNAGISVLDVQAIIDERLEIGRADVTGKHDFASLRSGANLIYTGSRQTSSSLVENLPLGNQLMAKLGLRFYGHGPHAALEPTFPKDSLGQCWSFEREGERSRVTIKEWAGDEHELENEPDRGIYATLAVKLANPIYVKSVAIEHAPIAVSNNRATAIRKFRVIGFQTPDASDEPWLLGTFEYNSVKDKYLQEFDVDTKLENGMPIPKLASIALAIDSNWGAEYSCLYRFRVHGQNKYKN